MSSSRVGYSSDGLTPTRPAPPIPNNNSVTSSGSAQTIVRRGFVTVKEEGLRSWIWSKRWSILREQSLQFFKNEVSKINHILHYTLTYTIVIYCFTSCNYLIKRFNFSHSWRFKTVLHFITNSIKKLLYRVQIRWRVVRLDGWHLQQITTNGRE